MQALAEDIILIDRSEFMKEHVDVRESGIVRVIPANVTPRGMVLFGIKNSCADM